MSDTSSRTPQRGRSQEIEYDGDRLTAIILEGEGVAVPVRTICDVLGLDVEAQSERLRKHDVLARGLRIVNALMSGRVRSVVAILHRYIPFWLATVSPDQVSPAVREKLVKYQTEVADFLAIFYAGDVKPVPGSGNAEMASLQQVMINALQEARLVREALLAVQQQLSEQQTQQYQLQAAHEAIQSRQQEQDTRIEVTEFRVTVVEGVLDDLQGRISQHISITPAQREHIRRGIQHIASRYKKRTGKDIYGLLFYTFCKELGTNKYADLPAEKYDAAIEWIQRKAADYLPDDPDSAPPLQETLL